MTPTQTTPPVTRTPLAPPPDRSDARFLSRKSKTFGRDALAVGAAAIGLGGALLAVFLRRKPGTPGGHAAPDLAPGAPHPGPADRAPPAFRPDPTAVPTQEERDALRPATIPVNA